MKKLEYQVKFLTPAFLGNAEQSGQWRTPPFKALLRQWWRIRMAKQHQYDHRLLRESEGDLFGNAWLTDMRDNPLHRRSRIGLRLKSWREGTLTSQAWTGGQIESVTTTRDGKGSVSADVYLGYGPVLPKSKKENRPVVTIRPAINEKDEAELQLLSERSPQRRPSEKDWLALHDVLQLMAWFGTLGSRSRNGWGSLHLQPRNGTDALSAIPSASDPLLSNIGREWKECFELDWPHAMGMEGARPLVWLTSLLGNDWRKVMGCLANIRVEVRRVAKSFADKSGIGGIHLLSYPAGGKWTLQQLSKGNPRREDQEGRLASQLRFKVAASSKGLVGVVYHVPHRFPDVLFDRLEQDQKTWIKHNEQRVWQAIHGSLDQNKRLTRLGN